MSLLKRLFGQSGPDPKHRLLPLYRQIVAKARQPHWYEEGQVPDTLDGRFDMVSAVLTLVLLRLEGAPAHSHDIVLLTEVFVDDMDGQLREAGVGDVVVGKNMGKMMSALGGRLGAFRGALADAGQLDQAIMRNIHRDDQVDPAALAYVRQTLLELNASLSAQSSEQIAEGSATW